MYNPFKRIGCQCTFCNKIWRIPRYRILRFEKFFDIKKGQPFVWECHEGVVIPGTYINIHGKKLKIDPNNLDPNTEVMRFRPLFHDSNIPSFHVGGIKLESLKAT
jgi:hypothetical protein